MRRISRRTMLETLGAGLMGGFALDGCATAPSRVPAARPNIVFILADDLGYGDVGCYGQRLIQTPNIDAMAAEGVRFTQCYAGSTVCAPSRCALMTGRHTGHAFVRGNAQIPLRPDDTTVAELLKQAGYATGLFGKWGLGEPDTTGVPNRKGFDEFFGYLNQGHAHNGYPTYLWRNGTREPVPGNTERTDKHGVCAQCQTFANDLFTEEALSFIERHKGNPFFLYLAYTIPHANNERGAATGDGMEVPGYDAYANQPWPNPQKGHAALISRLDRDVGRVLAKLRGLGLDNNTIVFFTSDNGPHKEGGADPEFFHSAGPLRGYKRAMYEGGIRVPMIVRWPGVVPKGRSDQVWAFWDVMPTMAELAHVPAPQGIDGRSAMPLLLGEAKQLHEFLYWEFHEGGFFRAVRMGDWKAVIPGKGKPLELYDLSKDVGETADVAAEHPAIVARITEYLKSARTISEHWPVK